MITKLRNTNIYEVIKFLDTLLIIFIILKLTDNINWSWWLVTIPVWIFFTGILIYKIIKKLNNDNKR